MSLYVLSDINRRPTGMVVQKNYVNALQQIGAKLVSDPSNSGQHPVHTHRAARRILGTPTIRPAAVPTLAPAYRLTTVQIAPLLQEVQAQATPDSVGGSHHRLQGIHPGWSSNFPISSWESCNFADIDAITLDLDGAKMLAGRILHHAYASDALCPPASVDCRVAQLRQCATGYRRQAGLDPNQIRRGGADPHHAARRVRIYLPPVRWRRRWRCLPTTSSPCRSAARRPRLARWRSTASISIST